MRRKRRHAEEPKYHYLLPRDTDKTIVEALAMGSLAALRDYPEHKTHDQLEAEARLALVTLKAEKRELLTNDFTQLCKLYIAYYIGGFEDTYYHYEKDPERRLSDKDAVAEHGWIMTLRAQELAYAEQLPAIREDMKQFFPDR